jgi:hypothetical protein
MQLAFYFSVSAFGLAEQNVMEILGKDLLCIFFKSKKILLQGFRGRCWNQS